MVMLQREDKRERFNVRTCQQKASSLNCELGKQRLLHFSAWNDCTSQRDTKKTPCKCFSFFCVSRFRR